MPEFPRTMVGGVLLPRLICGTNWLLGYSHTSKAKDRLIKELFDTPAKLVPVLEVFFRAGCNAVMSMPNSFVAEALRETEQKTGVPAIWITTPSYRDDNPDTWPAMVDEAKKLGGVFCFPHQCVTDPLIDRIHNRLSSKLIDHLRVVRERDMIPGLSSHMPEAIACSDNCEADVETYIQPYNAAGFLCQVETDWIQHLIHRAHKPVMVIKPLAAGRLLPPTGLSFVWQTIRSCDMVTVGVMSPYEAEEVIEISLACLEKRQAQVELQTTRSKKGLLTERKNNM